MAASFAVCVREDHSWYRSAAPSATSSSYSSASAVPAFSDDSIGQKILAGYPGYSAAVKKRAIQALVTRTNWALLLFKQLDAGKADANKPDDAKADAKK